MERVFKIRPSNSGAGLLLGQRSHPQVGSDDLEVGVDLLGVLGLDGWVNNHIITWHPVNRGGDLVLVTSLQRVEDSKHLGGVAACRSRVGEDGTDGLLGVNEEDGSNGEGNALGIHVGRVLTVQHVVQQSDLSVLVTNDGEVQGGVANVVDVLDPFSVAVDGVGRQTDQLGASLCEFRFQLGESSQLGGAN